MTSDITTKQKILMKKFYSVPATKAVFVKEERSKIWQRTKDKTDIDVLENLYDIKSKCPAIYYQIKRNYENGTNVQSAVFSECSYAQTLANMFGLDVFAKYSEGEINFPIVKKAIKENNITPRYYYTNREKTEFLIQAGGCGGIDCVYVAVKNSEIFTVEFKEFYAKTSEVDLPKYGEDGKIVVTKGFLSKNPQFEKMLEEQKDLNFFEEANFTDRKGHNINDFSDESVMVAVDNNYKSKQADVICFENKKGYLMMIPSNQMSKWVGLEGEIRPAGRNPYKVWTPKTLNKLLIDKGAVIEGEKVTIDSRKMMASAARGGSKKISRQKINSLFFVRVKDCMEKNGKLHFDIKKVRQLNPTIAVKMTSSDLDYEDIKNHYEKMFDD